ncbi:MAG: hypothetical protein HY565_01220 [Candidatus Kerfeldbacteria bacterium]|nr:hypothetical protein [Candidatus Kerfeldbacteria bacterium]
MNPSLCLDIAEFEIYLLKGVLLQDPIDLEFVVTHATKLAAQANEPTLTDMVTGFCERASRCGYDAMAVMVLVGALGRTRETIKARPLTSANVVPANGC